MSDKYPRKKSLVDYTKISDRPVQDARFEKAASSGAPVAPPMQKEPVAAGSASVPRMSTQMDAVMRLMTGREERTIAEKLADSNRPTWEAYKKENEDKLNMDGAEEEKMEQYRRELDAQRDKLLARASGRDNGKKRKKKKKRRRHESSGSDSSSESTESDGSHDHKRRKRHRKKHKKKRRHRRRDSDSDSEDSDRRRKHSKKRKKREEGGEESDGSHYKLSKFFAEGAENNS